MLFLLRMAGCARLDALLQAVRHRGRRGRGGQQGCHAGKEKESLEMGNRM
jgi:hypothetical protein